MSRIGALQLTKQTGHKHTGTVIFFHGSGGTGDSMKEWVHLMLRNFSFPHLKILYPTAPVQPYTPNMGMDSNVWFDRADISPTAPEKLESINKMESEVRQLIQKENDAGIPNDRIIVGGFSMGGALSFHIAYRWERSVAGIFAFSSFLNNPSAVYDELKKTSSARVAPLLQIHGDNDDLVLLEWSEDTFNQLKRLGVKGEFHVMKKLGHSINRGGMTIIKEWVEKIIPNI